MRVEISRISERFGANDTTERFGSFVFVVVFFEQNWVVEPLTAQFTHIRKFLQMNIVNVYQKRCSFSTFINTERALEHFVFTVCVIMRSKIICPLEFFITDLTFKIFVVAFYVF